MKYYYTYVVICTQGKFLNKVYFGQHSTNNLNDGYIASGRKIRDYLKKYPNGYYRKILKLYTSQEEVDKAEYDLIHPHLGKEYCLNMRDGGYHPTLSKETKDLISKRTKEAMKDGNIRKKCAYWKGKEAPNKGISSKLKGTKKSEKTKQRMSIAQTGRIVSKETKQKLSDANKGKKRSIESRIRQSETIKGHVSYIKGKHRVYDNIEHTKWHFEK